MFFFLCESFARLVRFHHSLHRVRKTPSPTMEDMDADAENAQAPSEEKSVERDIDEVEVEEELKHISAGDVAKVSNQWVEK